MSGSKLSAKKPASIDDFIDGAERTPVDNKIIELELPWEKLADRPGKSRSFMTISWPEEYIQKLRFIKDNSPNSQASFIKEKLFPIIDAEIEAITKG